jgi:hypothetical protein
LNREPVPNGDDIFRSLKPFPVEVLKIYPKSFCRKNGLTYGLIRDPEGKKLVVMGEKQSILADRFNGRCHHHETTLKLCDLSPENTDSLMDLFPYTKPVSLRNYRMTVGTGDRLGVATPGHIRAVRKFDVRPVLAQQSVRENNQTGRNFKVMIQDAAWAVFQENYQEGYGADGDHVKSMEEVRNALDAGVSMITLDLSEKLHPEVLDLPKEGIDRKFKAEIDAGDAEVFIHLSTGKEFLLKGPRGEISIRFSEEEAKRNVLLFYEALDFTEEVYAFIRSSTGYRDVIDFEISIDETPFPTSPESHLFFILGLQHRGVRINSLAPRFVGEFQKGIDYRGDLESFRRQFYQHALIARDYGNYKISIHSGSDKFSIFPIAGELAEEGLHVKTAGTSWLEAMRLVALQDPDLYREMHRFALSAFQEASKLYHVTTDCGRIPGLKGISDQELHSFLDQEDSRQLLHITYGYLLNARDGEGKAIFRERFYRTLTEREEDYWSLLEKHIENHLLSLGLSRRSSSSLIQRA